MATKNSNENFSQHTVSHDSSMISAITLDSALLSSEILQYRFDPALEALKERKWAANPGMMEDLEKCIGELRIPSGNSNRFSNAMEGTDTACCAKPQRKPSMSKSSSSASLRSYNRTSTCSSDYRSSKNFVPANFFLDEEILTRADDVWVVR